jgi:formate-nitrite transporter family protein
MPGPQPNPAEIWEAAAEEGERRVSRGLAALVSTGFVGGADVMLGVAIMTSASGGLGHAMPHQTAATLGALLFGIGFVFISIGRSELFTENFLIPIAGAFTGNATIVQLVRLYAVTLVANLLGLFVLSAILVTRHVVDHDALRAAGRITDIYVSRSLGAALLSAIVAGAVMTLWTWLSEAAESDIARIAIAMIVGTMLALPTLNHAVVGTGEMMFGVMASTSSLGTWSDVYQNFGIALIGNLIGGVGLVTLTRVVQARGEDG